MVVRNHNLVFRPLRGGVGIFNPVVNEPGTLGLIVTGDGTDRWMVSCYHVLCGPGDSEPVYQPLDDAQYLVGSTDRTRARADFDCAAARILPGVESLPEVLGIGPLASPVAPEPGMAVIKSGAATGITEGTITDVRAGRVEIEPVGLPYDYELSAAGDSGSLWVVKASLSPVVLHQGGSARPRSFAYGIALVDALAALNLNVLPLARPAGGSS